MAFGFHKPHVLFIEVNKIRLRASLVLFPSPVVSSPKPGRYHEALVIHYEL